MRYGNRNFAGAATGFLCYVPTFIRHTPDRRQNREAWLALAGSKARERRVSHLSRRRTIRRTRPLQKAG